MPTSTREKRVGVSEVDSNKSISRDVIEFAINQNGPAPAYIRINQN